MKKFLSTLLAKETLIKIILVQIIVLLFLTMIDREITVSHRGYLDLGSQYGGVELKIEK